MTIGWFVDYEGDPESPWYDRWVVCLETGEGFVPTLPIAFDTEEEAERWMRVYVLGRGALP